MQKPTKVVLVDDHALLRNGLAVLVKSIGYTVLYECSNGKDFVQKIQQHEVPDLVLLDLSMPEMDGFETSLWIKKHYPWVNVIALSMYDDETSIIRMLKNGAKGYILKDTTPNELETAIESVTLKGYYYSDLVSGRLIRSIQDESDADNTKKAAVQLNAKEIDFLKLCATEMTYKEIAQQMHLSPRTIDGYREALFEKLKVKSRVGLVLYAIKQGYIHLN